MKKKRRALVLLPGYCIPFVFLAMYGDWAYGTMWLYVLMLAGMGLLWRAAVRSQAPAVLVLGNLLSCGASLLCVSRFPAEWNWYFKPFTPAALALLLSAAVFFLQFFLWLIARKQQGRP